MKNPWVITGGSVMGIIDGYLLENRKSDENCRLVLTKPIGSQMIINFNQYFRTNPDFKDKILKTGLVKEEKIRDLFEMGFD